mgnify:CR=1 FL=1
MSLAPYACHERHSRGRRCPEPPPELRTQFQRDRDRIIHSAAFRRLEYKTQVFVNHEGDLYRTRLTHSLEVAQIGRAVARIMGLNEDLTEAITLAHDLGHTPFGHAGQEALNRCMKEYGGFEHNRQSLRVVDELEEKYAEFQGLNLTFETREGILKHCSPEIAAQLGEVGRRFIEGGQPSLEAQVANLSDEIAYNSHDVDDGLRSGLLTVEQLQEVTLFRNQYKDVINRYPQLSERRVIHEVVRRMINQQVVDIVESSLERLEQIEPREVDDVRRLTKPVIGFSPAMAEQNRELKHFLLNNLYRHHRVYRMSVKAQRLVTTLFDLFFTDPLLLPPQTLEVLREQETIKGGEGRAQAVADYIAGMTDRFAIAEHQRLVDP